MEKIPEYYYISKGTAKYNETENIMEMDTYMYEISHGEDGFMIAQCPELHAVTQGRNWDELRTNILEVHSLMLER